MQRSERPEYIYDYHWGRIVLTAILLVGLGIGAYQFIFSSSEETTQRDVVQKQKTDIYPTEKIEADTSEAKAVSEELVTVKVSQLDKKRMTAIQEVEAPFQKTETAEINAIALELETLKTKEAATKKTPETTSSIEIKAKQYSTKTLDTRTKAELFTATIKRAKLTDQVKRREPGNALPQALTLDPNGLSKVYFYTEVIGQAGKTHYHHWYRNGKLQAKVPITIGSDRWRCYSSKYLTQQQTGEWTVKVKNAKGQLLAQSDFNLINQ